MALGVILPVVLPTSNLKSITLTLQAVRTKDFDFSYFLEHCYSGRVESLRSLCGQLLSKKHGMERVGLNC